MNKHLLIAIGALSVAGSALAADPSNPPATDQPAVPAAEAPAATAPDTAASQQPQGIVARSAFTTAIQDREPLDHLTTLSTDHNKIYFFTELRGMTGQTVKHRREYNGKVMAEVPFEIGGPRWRVYSSKNLDPCWTGEWKVSVIDSNGSTLSVKTFRYTPAESAAPAAPAADQPAAESTPAAPAAPSAPAGSVAGY